jgi:hypothetical protein
MPTVKREGQLTTTTLNIARIVGTHFAHVKVLPGERDVTSALVSHRVGL